MEKFKQYIKERGQGEPVDGRTLAGLLAAHPWFVTARRVAASRPENRKPKTENRKPEAEISAPSGEAAIVERFLDGGEHRISLAPAESFENAPVSSAAEAAAAVSGFRSSVSVQTPQGLVSETLARIYLDQQLWEQARAAYRQLSLAYPQKNAYFAAILAEIDRAEAEQKNE